MPVKPLQPQTPLWWEQQPLRPIGSPVFGQRGPAAVSSIAAIATSADRTTVIAAPGNPGYARRPRVVATRSLSQRASEPLRCLQVQDRGGRTAPAASAADP
jgi:hypothetical protein